MPMVRVTGGGTATTYKITTVTSISTANVFFSLASVPNYSDLVLWENLFIKSYPVTYSTSSGGGTLSGINVDYNSSTGILIFGVYGHISFNTSASTGCNIIIK